MKITNRLGLPESIVAAVSNDPYTRGDAHISVTGLIGPARKRQLEHQYADKIEEDAASRIWALLGQVVHGILERAETQAWTERRLYIERHGWRISGAFDRFILAEGRVQDFKTTSTYTVKDGVKPEWESQVNLYGHLLREHGHDVRALEIVPIFRDWQRAKALHTPDYPQTPCIVMPVPMWSSERCEEFIYQRLLAHADAQHVLPDCTAEERWEKPAVFALTKVGNKRATSLHDSMAEGQAALKNAQATARKDAEFALVERPAEQTRCAFYCPVAPFCEQWKKLGVITRIGELVNPVHRTT